MKFLLNSVISYDEIYAAIASYRNKNGIMPSYILIHPETRRKIIISSQDEMNSLSIRVIDTFAPLEGLRTTNRMFGLFLISTLDVEPDFIIICG